MIETRPVRGIVPVLLTPMTESGDVDVPALTALVQFLTSLKIGGLWVLGTGSEDMNLTFKKRLLVAQAACEANAGKVPLMLGAGFFAMEDILEFIKETKGLEKDAYHVMPYHPLLSLDRVDWFYRHIADRCEKPLWMYTSANWARPITPGFVANLKSHPNICGIKFSTKDAVAVTKVAGMAEKGFQIITAVASQLFGCLCMGSKAHTSSLGSAIPEELIKIYEMFLSGDHAAALAEQHRLNRFLEQMGQNTKKDNFLQAGDEKYILSKRGICKEYVSSYYRRINEQEKNAMDALLDEYRFF